jgi:hypothetical protein
MGKVRDGLVNRSNATATGHVTGAYPPDLREVEPHAVTSFGADVQLRDNAVVDGFLCVNETLQVEGVVGRHRDCALDVFHGAWMLYHRPICSFTRSI